MRTDTDRPGLVGSSVKRVNDPRLLVGRGRFIDDISMPGMAHATIVRSTIPSGTVTSFDVADCEALLVLGVDEIAAATRPIPCVWIAPGQEQVEVPVASRQVRYVGQPIGIVVAPSRAEAEDAVECLAIDLAAEDGVADSLQALEPGAPLVYPERGSNIGVEFPIGDPSELVEEAMASAAVVVSRRLRIPRIVPSPLETRGVIADWNPGLEQLTVWMSTQTPHHVRDHIAHSLRLRADQVRVVAGDVGGGFGSKEHLYADELLVCLAAMRLGRPVKWIEDRVEHFTATFHGRDAYHDARLAMTEDGTFLAIHTSITGNLGAHFSNVGTGPFRVSAVMLPGPYRLPVAGASIRAVFTNTTPTGAYRGFGMQEAAWVRERLVDEAARELGMSAIELRRKNMYRSDELPLVTPTFQEYDSGDYGRALDLVDARVRAYAPAPPASARIRQGIAVATHVEFTGLGPSKAQDIVGFRLGGYETAVVRMEPDGSVFVSSGVMGMGQGIETTLAQLAADRLGVPLERVRVQLGDTGVAPYSAAGSIASRSMTVGGGAVVRASTALREKILRIAGAKLEVSPSDLELVEGQIHVKGDPRTGTSLEELVTRAWLGLDLPEGESPDLECKYVHEPLNISYPYATHAAAVSVDLDTGQVAVDAYWVAHDSGVVVNPMIVDGQIMGGVAQGLGIALFEKMLYADDGQPLSTTFMDYLIPLSSDVPTMVMDHYETPAPHIPGGMKGVGEGGTIVAPAAIGNAIAAALPEIAEQILETPLSPGRLWTLIHKAGLHDG
ncbi:MAG: xanthine dehydrogenase family protein molybdopterin-binding subunit [Actinomycetota bacterium]|nr:xanthine dehydrogenase family protein molybdopterin-binding subunit [Actinomycetota bacterium]